MFVEKGKPALAMKLQDVVPLQEVSAAVLVLSTLLLSERPCRTRARSRQRRTDRFVMGTVSHVPASFRPAGWMIMWKVVLSKIPFVRALFDLPQKTDHTKHL